MSTDYNIVRGMGLVESKIGQELKRKGASDAVLEAAIAAAKAKFEGLVGVMPINGLHSAAQVAEACNQALRGVSSPEEAREAVSGVVMGRRGTGEVRRVEGSFAEQGREREVQLDYDAADLSAEIADNSGSDTEIRVMVSEGGRVKEIVADVVDMLPYVDSEDLTDEGKRSLGYLPADFDSMSTLGADTPEVEVETRRVGRYGYDADGQLFIESPDGCRDVVPMGTGTYMCLETGTVFDVDLLINDLLPEDH